MVAGSQSDFRYWLRSAFSAAVSLQPEQLLVRSPYNDFRNSTRSRFCKGLSPSLETAS